MLGLSLQTTPQHINYRFMGVKYFTVLRFYGQSDHYHLKVQPCKFLLTILPQSGLILWKEFHSFQKLYYPKYLLQSI